MNRFFGSTAKAPKPTLNSAIGNGNDRISSIDVKLSEINGELQSYQTKLSRMRDGPGKTALKQKALKVLQRRKQYEAQRDQLQSQVWNMEQAQTMQDNLKNVMTTVDALKSTNKELRRQYGKVDIDKIERLQDEMADLMDVGNDIQEEPWHEATTFPRMSTSLSWMPSLRPWAKRWSWRPSWAAPRDCPATCRTRSPNSSTSRRHQKGRLRKPRG